MPMDPAPRKTRKRTSPEVLKRFSIIFNQALDQNNVKPLHFGRHVAVANMFNVSISAARKWITGDSLPDTDNLIAIAHKFGYTVDMLIGNEDQRPKSNFVTVPVMEIGSNSQNVPRKVINLDDALLDDSMRMKINDIEVYPVDNDDMSPEIYPGDYVFIEMSASSMEDRRVYVFETNDSRVLIRKVNLELDGSYLLTCADRRNRYDIRVAASDISIDGWPSNAPKTLLRMIGPVHGVFKRSIS